MAIIINGTGSISGLSAGGLPDNSITSDDIATNAVTEAKLATGLYTCKAWVNFNGTGTVAIRASGNVSSITDNGTGDYTVNFTTAMPDANYSWGFGANNSDDLTSGGNSTVINTQTAVQTASSLRIQARYQVTTVSGLADMSLITVTVFR